MTKQILAFLFCFTRELNPNSPLTFSHIPRANSNPILPPYLTPPPPPFLRCRLGGTSTAMGS
jgi:hypothetical protein